MRRQNDFELRVAVGTVDGPQSAVLRVWSRRDESSVYAAVREIGARFKISLHDGGRCHAGLTSEFANEEPQVVAALGGSRHQNAWQRRTPTGQEMEVPIVCVFPSWELTRWRDTPVKAPSLRWLPPPVSRGVVAVACTFTSSEIDIEHWPGRAQGHELLDFKRLPNGETLWVVSYFTDRFSRVTEVLAFAHKRIATESPVQASTGPKGFPGKRLLIFDFHESARTLMMIDASSPPELEVP